MLLVGGMGAHGAPPTTQRETPAGEGVYCADALLSAAAEGGRRCTSGQNPEFQKQLAEAVALLDRYILENSNATPADLARFKNSQALAAATNEQVCKSDALMMYQAVEKQGGDKLLDGIRKMVARPGKPTLGDCT